MKNYEDVQSKLYEGKQQHLFEVIVETKEIHRLEAYGDNEEDAIRQAFNLLDVDVPLSNRSVSYNVMDIVLKDEYLN